MREKIKRNWLKKQIKAGNILIINEDNFYGQEPRKANIKNFEDHDFNSKIGFAFWEDKDKGLIHWSLCCGHFYSLKIISAFPVYIQEV